VAIERDAIDVPALHASFDEVKRILHATAHKDAATSKHVATFDANIGDAYAFVEQRKAFLAKLLGQAP
jgi:hypothetical protein